MTVMLQSHVFFMICQRANCSRGNLPKRFSSLLSTSSQKSLIFQTLNTKTTGAHTKADPATGRHVVCVLLC